MNNIFYEIYNDLFDSLTSTSPRTSSNEQFLPYSIYDLDETYIIELFAAGIKKEHVDIEFKNNTLTVSSTRDKPISRNIISSSWNIAFGKFVNTFAFKTPIKHDDISVKMENGMLIITVQKSQKEKSTKINIE